MDMVVVMEYIKPGTTYTVPPPEFATLSMACWIVKGPPGKTSISIGLAKAVWGSSNPLIVLSARIVYKNNPLDIFKILRSSLEG
jgi:hypothetical protein